MKNKQEKIKTPMEKYEEAALELALFRVMQDERKKALAQLTPQEEEEMQQSLDATRTERLRFIGQVIRKQHMKERLKRCSLQVLKTAAVALFMVSVSVTVTVAASSELRAQVAQFLTQRTDSYIEMKYVPNGEHAEIPAEWTANYFPSYIPEGYYLWQCVSPNGDGIAVYKNNKEQRIYIEVNGIYSITRVDSENAETSTALVNGVNATVLVKNNWKTVLWTLGDKYFIVSTCDVSMEETLRVAQSMSIIQK